MIASPLSLFDRVLLASTRLDMLREQNGSITNDTLVEAVGSYTMDDNLPIEDYELDDFGCILALIDPGF